jgi:exosortase/archaeosortase family protein
MENSVKALLKPTENETRYRIALFVMMIGCQVAAFYPVLVWLSRRISVNDEGLCACVAGGVGVLFMILHSRPGAPSTRLLTASALITGLYAVTFAFTPGLGKAFLAVTALYCTGAAFRTGSTVHAPCVGLFLLALPVIPSFQFYLGYPMRVISGLSALAMLRMNGYAVSLSGVALKFGESYVLIDAPCSGVNMLWTALFMALAVSGMFQFNSLRTCLAVAVAVTAVTMGNGIRAAALFQAEVGGLNLPAWSHTAAGLVSFAGITILAAGVFYLKTRRASCVPVRSTC